MYTQGEEHPDYSKACVRAHNGAIISLQRSPFFEDVVVSVGDWSLALWKEGQHQTPLFTSPHAPAPYTAGCWSPTRPGVPGMHAVLFLTHFIVQLSEVHAWQHKGCSQHISQSLSEVMHISTQCPDMLNSA